MVEFIRMMSPELGIPSSFEYPLDRLLRLNGTIPEKEMRYPTTHKQNGDPCLIVLKRGNGSGLTIGLANDVFSYSRNYDDNGNAVTSKEWGILPLDSKSRAFSVKGDSGSVIVDGRGRMGGLLTGGCGQSEVRGSPPSLDLDITYATPINFLLKRMHENGLANPNINPVLTT
jgi:hypothetical protein